MSVQAAEQAQARGEAALAEQLYREHLRLQPHDAAALLGLSSLLSGLGRLSEALPLASEVLRSRPGHVGALNALAGVALAAGQIEQALDAYRRLLSLASPPLLWRAASNYLTALQYQPGLSSAQLRDAATAVGREMGRTEPVPRVAAAQPIHLGFVSADLCDHPVGLFLLPLLRHLDPQRMRISLFSNGGRADETARQLMTLGVWHDVAALAHDDLVSLIRSQAVDVLIDLSGHTAGNRLPAFARRAAPLQLSWLGYFATTGVPAMDHVLMDEHHVPDGAEAQFSEHVVRLPFSRFCYAPVPFAPAVAPPPCMTRGHVTFGSFNNTAKLNDAVLDTWAAILRAVPDSRLLLKWRTFADDAFRARVIAHFAQAGVDAGRIELRPQSFHVDVLRQYADVDIALDPFPFTGGHTSCEALWMGLPVITLPGERAVSRQTLCFIANLQREEWRQQWVASSPQDYIDKACALARNPQQLVGIRQALRPMMQASPLMDAARFAADFQSTIESLLA